MEHAISNGNPPPLYVPAGMFKTTNGYIVKVANATDVMVGNAIVAQDAADMWINQSNSFLSRS